VSGALLSAALAVLLWPGRSAVRGFRLSVVAGAVAPRRRRRPPFPVLAALGAGGIAAGAGTLLVVAIAAVSAYLGARAWAAGRARASVELRMKSLADGLGALAADLRSGRSMEASAHVAAQACADADLGRALARAVRVPGAGPSAGDPVLDGTLARISAAVVLSSRTGCSLAAVVGAIEDDLRARTGHRLELRSAVAGPRASAALLAGLPVLGLAMGSGVGADPWRVLTTTTTGQVLLVVGVGLEFAGLAWSRRLIDRALRT